MNQALSAQNWEKAKNFARNLDEKSKHGDIFLAFVSSRRALAENRCESALKLTHIVALRLPNFAPSYEVAAICLIKLGRHEDAVKVLRSLANKLPESPTRKLIENQIATLDKRNKPRISVDLTIKPSSNLRQRNTAGTSFAGFTINEESGAKAGLNAIGSVKLIKPIFRTNRMLSEVSLKLGGGYIRDGDQFSQITGLSFRQSRFWKGKGSLYAEVLFDQHWLSAEPVFHLAGLQFGATRSLADDISISSQFQFSYLNHQDNDRDAFIPSLTLTGQKNFGAKDKVLLKATGTLNKAQNEFYTSRLLQIGFEWEHLFANGFITSLGASGGIRDYDRLIPLTTIGETRFDQFAIFSAGISHQKFSWRGIRPELVYSHTIQNSNDPFHKFQSHDLNLKFKALF